MRQTVYIQDDLLQRAQALLPDINPSQLVQRGLAQLIGDLQGPVYASVPLDAVASDIERLRDHFAIEAKFEYESGFQKAIAAADSLSWRLLEDLAENHNDLKRALRPYVNGAARDAMSASPKLVESEEKPWAWLYRLARDIGSMADPIGYDEFSFDPTRAFLRGYGDALYAVWAAVEEGVDPSRHLSGKLHVGDERALEHPNLGVATGVVDEDLDP